jgi:uncharacterized membrane protein YphA (DoxX/SURF4 family)
MILNVILWIAQIALAAMFLFAGYIKLVRPIPELVKMFPWPGDVPVWFTRLTGWVDLAGAVGIVLPQLTGILPWLTPLAALGLVALQAAAIVFHGMRGETKDTVAMNIVLLAASAFVAWGRWDLFG